MTETFYSNYPNSYAMNMRMKELKQWGDICQVDTFGFSLLNKPLYKVSFGNPNKQVLLVGGFHALENLTTMVLFQLIDDLIDSLTNDTPFVKVDLDNCFDDVGITIIPCLNPDGVDISLYGAERAEGYENLVAPLINKKDEPRIWQANARGVDLNHNFDAGYHTLKAMEKAKGITGPRPTQYGGQYAHSEPETKALVDLVNASCFTKVYAFHSQGEEIFYEYGRNTPPQSRLIAEILAKASGYELIKQGDLASHGGFKDWFIEKHKKPGFTFELGLGKNPLPVADFPNIYHKLKQTLSLLLVL